MHDKVVKLNINLNFGVVEMEIGSVVNFKQEKQFEFVKVALGEQRYAFIF